MSSDIVKGNALQFTNDNKHVYAYSGVVGVSNSEKTMLLFNTNSEYLKVLSQPFNSTASNDDLTWKIYFNDVIVYEEVMWNISFNRISPRLVIPPFTTVKVTCENTGSATSRNACFVFSGEAYMTNRVGNLDD